MTTTLSEQQVETMFTWGEPKEINTKFGKRFLHKAKGTPEAIALYQENARDLSTLGVQLGDAWRQPGVKELCWWRKPTENQLQQLKAALEASHATDADVQIPAPDGLDYLGYQRAGIAWAMKREGTLIGDEMGLGKTIQAIGLINGTPEIHRALIVCPAGLKLNWYKELRRWLVRKLTVGIASSDVFPTTDIVIINYDILHKYPKRLELYWDLVVIDEAHYCKNPKARRTIQIFGYRPSRAEAKAGKLPIAPMQARRRVAMSGTPMVNRPVELFPIINWLDPKGWPNFWTYAKRYCNAHNNGFGMDLTGASNLEELQEKLRRSIMVRRLKKDVLTELPPKTRQVIELPSEGLECISSEHKALDEMQDKIADLKAAVELAKAGDNEELYRKAVEALTAGCRVGFTEVSKVRHETALAKVPQVVTYLEDALAEGKVILFAHHRDVIDAYMQAFPQAVKIVGGMSPEEKQASADRFMKDPKCDLIIGNETAMGMGWTLTASSRVIFAELDWVPGIISQCEDRAHRIGQKDNVLVTHLVLEGSIDATMAKRIIEKQEVIDRAMDRELATEPVIPIQAATDEAPMGFKQVAEAALALTKEQIAAVHQGLKMLAGMDADHARFRNDMGFSQVDGRIGHSLAHALWLSPKQAVIGRRLVRKYRRQLPEELVATAWGPEQTSTN